MDPLTIIPLTCITLAIITCTAAVLRDKRRIENAVLKERISTLETANNNLVICADRGWKEVDRLKPNYHLVRKLFALRYHLFS